MPARVKVVEEFKNAVGTCNWASPPPVVDLRLGTEDGSYVVVVKKLMQCALLNQEQTALSLSLSLSLPWWTCSWAQRTSAMLSWSKSWRSAPS